MMGEPESQSRDEIALSRGDEQLIARYIALDPQRPWPEEARLVQSGVSVWAIIGYLPAVGGDLKQVALAYDIPIEAVIAALAYYEKHKPAIDARLAENAAIFAG
jgi:uncharacterized protein (DUF433 family)